VYKLMVRSSGAQRESGGVVVPPIGVRDNAPGGKGPCFDHAGGVGKGGGVAGFAWSGFPGGWLLVVAAGGLPSFAEVRLLRRGLWAAARQSPERRFDARYDRVRRGGVLRAAWDRVRVDRGAAGVGRVILAEVREVYGAARFLGELVREILASLGLEPHPDKTKVADLREGGEGLDFPGCRVRARRPGRRREQKRVIRCCPRRWPSQRAMKRLGDKIRDRAGRNRAGTGIRDVIADLNPVLRGWGSYFRTGNAAVRFRPADRYAEYRLRGLMIKKRGRNLRAGQSRAWTEDWFSGHGLYRLRGTVRSPKAA
jgi:Group II intron, maturase-specific domain